VYARTFSRRIEDYRLVKPLMGFHTRQILSLTMVLYSTIRLALPQRERVLSAYQNENFNAASEVFFCSRKWLSRPSSARLPSLLTSSSYFFSDLATPAMSSRINVCQQRPSLYQLNNFNMLALTILFVCFRFLATSSRPLQSLLPEPSPWVPSTRSVLSAPEQDGLTCQAANSLSVDLPIICCHISSRQAQTSVG
jgi:hypothetical protein